MSIDHLQPFGRKCFVQIHKDSRPSGSKLLPRANEGNFVGYTESTKILRIGIPSKNKVVESPNVKFAPLNSGEVTNSLDSTSGSNFETQTETISFHPNLLPRTPSTTAERSPTLDSTLSSPLTEPQNRDDIFTSEINQHQSAQPETSEPRHRPLSVHSRPKRSIKPIERYGSPIYHGPNIRTREEHDSEQGRQVVAEEDQNDVEYHAIALAARSAPEIHKEPKSIREAFQQTDENRWREAIKKELLCYKLVLTCWPRVGRTCYIVPNG